MEADIHCTVKESLTQEPSETGEELISKEAELQSQTSWHEKYIALETFQRTWLRNRRAGKQKLHS